MAVTMESYNFLKKKLKQHLFVNPGSLEEATDYYVEAFGAVKKKGFLFPHYVELFLAETTLVISEGIKDPFRDNQIRLEVIANVDEVKALALRPENAVDYSWSISDEEVARGIRFKILDPYGYIWALSQSVTSNICKLCFCSSQVHIFDSLCTHPKTLAWIEQASDTPSSVKELNFTTKFEEKLKKFIKTCEGHVESRSEEFETDIYHGFPSLMDYMINVYRYMVVIRWAHLVLRFSTKEIERVFDDACERLDYILARVHTRLQCIKLDLDTSPLEQWIHGVESVQILLQTILAKIGFKEGMNDSINEELHHWNDIV